MGDARTSRIERVMNMAASRAFEAYATVLQEGLAVEDIEVMTDVSHVHVHDALLVASKPGIRVANIVRCTWEFRLADGRIRDALCNPVEAGGPA